MMPYRASFSWYGYGVIRLARVTAMPSDTLLAVNQTKGDLMALLVITCADCGAERTTARKNTKYCEQCRLLRDMVHMGADKKRKCILCDAVFAPLHARDEVCAEHDTNHPQRYPIITCGASGKEGPQVRDGLQLTLESAKNPEYRVPLMKELSKRQAERKAAR
jgi:hypothetical protein